MTGEEGNPPELTTEDAVQDARQKWLMENRAAIDCYNNHVEEQGVFSDGLRSF